MFAFNVRCVMSEAMAIAASLYNNPRFYSKSEIRIRNNKLRRQKIIRRQYMIVSAVVFVAMFLTVFYVFSFKTSAQSDSFVPEYKYYKNITIHSGDSLWSVANSEFNAEHYKDLNAYISEICMINSIDSDSILHAGESIVIPYYSRDYK